MVPRKRCPNLIGTHILSPVSAVPACPLQPAIQHSQTRHLFKSSLTRTWSSWSLWTLSKPNAGSVTELQLGWPWFSCCPRSPLILGVKSSLSHQQAWTTSRERHLPEWVRLQAVSYQGFHFSLNFVILSVKTGRQKEGRYLIVAG